MTDFDLGSGCTYTSHWAVIDQQYLNLAGMKMVWLVLCRKMHILT